MSYLWCVNKTGKNLPVYDTPAFDTSSKKTRIGTILNREVYISAIGSEHAPEFEFRNSSGKLEHGYGEWDGVWDLDGVVDSVWEYPAWVSGKDRMLVCRKPAKVYRPDGSYYATVPAGKHVKMKANAEFPNSAGSTHPEYMIIGAFQRSDGTFSTIGGSYGFVDMGIISTGSGYTKIPVYGSW